MTVPFETPGPMPEAFDEGIGISAFAVSVLEQFDTLAESIEPLS